MGQNLFIKINDSWNRNNYFWLDHFRSRMEIVVFVSAELRCWAAGFHSPFQALRGSPDLFADWENSPLAQLWYGYACMLQSCADNPFDNHGSPSLRPYNSRIHYPLHSQGTHPKTFSSATWTHMYIFADVKSKLHASMKGAVAPPSLCQNVYS